MRTRWVLRRRATVAVAVAAAAVVTTAALVVTSPGGAGAGGGHAATSSGRAEDGNRGLPAPPRPDRLRPAAKVLAAAAGSAAGAPTAIPGSATGKGAPGSGAAKTLVLYDTTGPYAWLGEIYGIQAANLASHFGAWTAAPVANYRTGDMAAYTAVIYVGSTYDEPLPVAFLDDVTAGSRPVVWMYDNIWQLQARDAAFAANRGFGYRQFDVSPVDTVTYKGKALTRDARNTGGIMDLAIGDPAKVTVLAEARRADGSTFPWAVRSGNLTYLGEIPFSYVTHDDRYLAFADLLFDALAPGTPTRRRALARIEDVGPDSDPAELRAVADYLAAEKVPFSVAVYARYRNPAGVGNNGRAEDYTLLNRPEVVKALKYMQSKGGTLLMHGYTHQNDRNTANPYDGVSANDFEFYRAHVDADNYVVYDGPVAGDSARFVSNRVRAARTIFARAGLGQPTIFEFPHYAGSAVDYKQINAVFGTRYDRTLFFPGVLTGKAVDHTRPTGQFFPYPVRDVYGSAVVPENIGNIEPDSFNNHPARLPADLLASADRNEVVRDATASFFYHPYLGTGHLKQVVTGLKAEGWTFVTAASTVAD